MSTRRCPVQPLGNWDQTVVDSTTETRVHNSVNELTARTVGQDPQISLTYDNAGNLTQDGSADGDHKFTWDYRNRLIEVEEKQSGNWVTVAEYLYDGLNRRVRKVVTNKGSLNGTTRYIWGGDSNWQCLEERDGSNDLVARYTYSPGYIDAVAVQERDLNSDDDFGDDDEVVYYHGNTLSSVYCLTDDGENVAERYRFDGYGACTVLDADGSDDSDNASDVENPFLFTGRRLDSEWSGMQYRHRSYSTTLGRFVSRDPAESEPGYSYVGDAPTALVDPEGLQCMCCCAQDIKITDVKGSVTISYFGNPSKHRRLVGAKHTVKIHITYRNVALADATEDPESARCTLEYWEKANVESTSVQGAPVNQWYDAYEKRRTMSMFGPWNKRDVETPGEHTVVITDAPSLGVKRGPQRTLYLAIILRSGKACECDEDEVVVYATQHIRFHKVGKWPFRKWALAHFEFLKGEIPEAEKVALESARQPPKDEEAACRL